MVKQDRHGVRQPMDLERKYDLAAIQKLKDKVEKLEKTIDELNLIVNELTGKIG